MSAADNSTHKVPESDDETPSARMISHLHGEIHRMEMEINKLTHECGTMRIAINIKEASWEQHKCVMQRRLDLALQGQAGSSAAAKQAGLEDEIRDLKFQVRDRDKFIHKLSAQHRVHQHSDQRGKAMDDKMKQMICEKDAEIAKLTKERVALRLQNLQLLTKLRTIQREGHQGEAELTALEVGKETDEVENRPGSAEKSENQADSLSTD